MKHLISVIFIFITIIIIALAYNAYFMPKTITINDIYPDTADIDKISIVIGNTGERFSITDQKDIKDILNIIENAKLSKARDQRLKPGYTYDMSFYKNDAIYFGISIAGNEVRFDRKVYITNNPISKDVEMIIKKYH